MTARRRRSVRSGARLLLVAGCAVAPACTYASDRLRDAADVVTLTWGLGAGVQPRVGPLTTGLMANAEYGGLRGGCIDAWSGRLDHWFVFAFGSQTWPVGEPSRRRGKAMPWIVTQTAWWPYVVPPPKGDTIPVPASYFTDLELQVGLGVSVRLGCNPIEFGDFLLGWCGLDLYGDDLGVPLEIDEDAAAQWRRVLTL